jgi:hypothetical protein
MITHLKILSTPYYVDHNRSFDSKPVCNCADGREMCSRPLLGDLHIAFRAERSGSGQRVIVIMNDLKVWMFNLGKAPTEHFKIGAKVPSEDMEQHIVDLYNNGDGIKIEYENV